MLKETVHIPVMMSEALKALHLKPGMNIVDATLGGGGYTIALHERIMPGGRVIATDQDADAIERFAQKHGTPEGITIVHSNYSRIAQVIADEDLDIVDGIVADLGLSSDQLEEADRGFSFLHDGPIDMRMDQDTQLSAHKIVNEYSHSDLSRILRVYGDEKYAIKIATAIIAARPLETTGDLSQVVSETVGGFYARASIHPATRTFQAIRIATNDEYGHIEQFLDGAIDSLASEGYLSVVSFHSGEDRIVKNVFREAGKSCVCEEAPVCICEGVARVRVVTSKAIEPSEFEVMHNPRARSARLRVVQKI